MQVHGFPSHSSGQTLVLGILNVTPDSFSDGGRFLDPGAALAHAFELVQQGFQALDVGAESTRPNALAVPPEEEWARLEPVLTRLRAELPHLPISLDTRHAVCAARALQGLADVINDVTGFSDPDMLDVVRRSSCGVIAMRSRIAPDGSFHMPPYGAPAPPEEGRTGADAAIQELAAVRDRLLGAGLDPERILLDPGFGFGMPYHEDLALWEALPRLPQALDWPVEGFCIGISRKRLLAWRAGQPDLPALDRDGLTQQAHLEAEALGYRVLRSHTLANEGTVK